MSEKPTIEELEKILEENSEDNVRINPDGSVTVDSPKERIEALEAEVARLRELLAEDRDKWSFDALVWWAGQLLDGVYPRDIFTGTSGDDGPRLIAALRAIHDKITDSRKAREEKLNAAD